MIYQIGNYQIRPYSNGLCYELFEYRQITSNKGDSKGETREDWVSMGKYPSTFGDALRLIHEAMLKDGKGTIKGLKAAITHVDKLRDELMKEVEK